MTDTASRDKHGDASDGRLGGRLARVDGPAKVTGAATYALEHRLEGLAHAVLVQATVPSGWLRAVDAAAAEAVPGVLLVLTPETAGALDPASGLVDGSPGREPFRPLRPDIRFSGQAVAAVVAETVEQATAAAALLHVHYEETAATPTLDGAGEGRLVEGQTIAWGDAQRALASAPVRVEATYRTPREYNLPMEPHGLVAHWTGDGLVIHEPSQWIDGMARIYAEWFGLPFEAVRVVSPFIGGGFGSKALPYEHGAVAVLASRRLGRPVKLAVTRPQTFTAFGGRPATRQTLALGATREGRLLAILQRGVNETSVDETAVEPLGSVTALMYAVPHFSSRQAVVPVNTVKPGALRAPGENPSAFGIECAIDELAHAVGLDPLAIRLLNYAEVDPRSGKPWSTRRLREAFTAGAERFGWHRRSLAPRSMRRGRRLVGWGMAAGCYPVYRSAGEAMVRLLADGSVEVASSAVDMGQGTYTVLAQVAAEALGVPVETVRVSLGDSALPRAPVAGGSQLANLMAGAVHKAAMAACEELVALGLSDPGSPFREAGANTLAVAEGRIGLPRGETLTIAAFLQRIGRERVEVQRDTLAENNLQPGDRHRNATTVGTMRSPREGEHALYSWCAHFAEVEVDEDFGTVRLTRMVSALDSGRLYNPRLAESQWRGGIIMGIGQALLEEGLIDAPRARVVNNNLADYQIATSADVPDIDVISVGVPDPHASALGGKAVGELGIVGVAPAIANAVFHATGRRVHDLPITLDKLI